VFGVELMALTAAHRLRVGGISTLRDRLQQLNEGSIGPPSVEFEISLHGLIENVAAITIERLSQTVERRDLVRVSAKRACLPDTLCPPSGDIESP
jgi:hypothetical protein